MEERMVYVVYCKDRRFITSYPMRAFETQREALEYQTHMAIENERDNWGKYQVYTIQAIPFGK